MIGVTIVTTSFYRQCIYDLYMTLTISSYSAPITVNHVVFQWMHIEFIMRRELTDFFYLI